MRKLNWDDDEIAAYADKCLSGVWNMRYNSVHCMANLLAGLAPYHVSIMYTWCSVKEITVRTLSLLCAKVTRNTRKILLWYLFINNFRKNLLWK